MEHYGPGKKNGFTSEKCYWLNNQEIFSTYYTNWGSGIESQPSSQQRKGETGDANIMKDSSF